jgi:hypothetical protein
MGGVLGRAVSKQMIAPVLMGKGVTPPGGSDSATKFSIYPKHLIPLLF